MEDKKGSPRDPSKKTMPSRKFIFLLFFIPSAISLLKLFQITTKSLSSSPLALPNYSLKLTRHPASHEEKEDDPFTQKEHQLLSKLISLKVPCNLLFFGFSPQLLNLTSLNSKGTTIFIEDAEENLARITPKAKGVRIYSVKHRKKAKEAFELLKHARKNPHCMPGVDPFHNRGCKLALTGLPKEVLERKWDVVVIDGPGGGKPEAPGRMGPIFAAAVIARAANGTDVLVHDTDRMIEKWYSWEFLCHENLVSSKGKLWHFRIEGSSKFAGFCST